MAIHDQSRRFRDAVTVLASGDELAHRTSGGLLHRDAFGVGAFAQRDYLRLSGGEQQCVQLARVLAQVWDAPAQGGRYLLLDEPTAGLDLRLQHVLLELARQLAAQGFGLLASLHDLNLAARFASHALVLGGSNAFGGRVDEVMTESALSAAFEHPLRRLRVGERWLYVVE
mgnify:CR=1 FL=1